ncbi:MAG TPA: L,D-transpeptidase family protein [Sphingomicrobium sp.]
MRNKDWIGAAVGLALCSSGLTACSGRDQSAANGARQTAGQSLSWTRQTQHQLLDAIAKAPANGLNPDLFLAGDLPKDDAQRFTVLTEAALKYAEALAHGYADPRKISDVYTIPRPDADLRTGLAQAIRDGHVDQWLDTLPPQTEEYRRLSDAHVAYLKMATGTPFQQIPAGKPIKPGSSDPRVPAVVAALRAVNYLPPAQPNAAPEARYGGAIVASVKQLQADFGIKADGIVGDSTRDALNLGPGGRARQLAIALERLRWLQRDPPRTRIDVNTAAAFLDYFRDGAQVDRRAVIAGEPDKATPQLQASFFDLVANPKWRVPDSIGEDEISTKSAAWLSANQFIREDGRWVQQSGPKNSLGLVKLDLDDPQQIYLHDTPFKALFADTERHRSHGCVRVANAVEFAGMLAQQDGVFDRFQDAMASGDETHVRLKTKIPVRLLYHTTYWDGSRVQFRPDVYGWDDDVGRVLGLVRGPERPSLQKSEDVGP